MKYKIIAIGDAKKTPFKDLIDHYADRIQTKLDIQELTVKHKDPKQQHLLENQKIRDSISPGAFVIALDKNGKMLDSPAFSQLLDQKRVESIPEINILIGGSEGLDKITLSLADISISFGNATWPHMLARVMLLEQLYRCQQISSGHPYHK